MYKLHVTKQLQSQIPPGLFYQTTKKIPSVKTGSETMSKTPLTEAEESLLGHGPNFVMVPKDPTNMRLHCRHGKGMPKPVTRQGRRAEG